MVSNQDIDFTTRATLTEAVVISTGRHARGSWPTLTAKELKPYHNALVRVYRDLTGNKRCKKDGTTDHQVIKKAGALLPVLSLMQDRLNLFCRLLRRMLIYVFVSLYHARGAKMSWLDTILADLKWLAVNAAKLEEFQDKPLSEWVAFITATPSQALKTLKAAVQQANVVELDRLMTGTVQQASLVQCYSMKCHWCDAMLSSSQALAVHISRKHGQKRIARAYAESSHCSTCLLAFGNRSRLISHWSEKGSLCFLTVVARVDPCILSKALQLDAEDQVYEKANRRLGRRYDYTSVPTVQHETHYHSEPD